jgi:hypothetical protein
MGRWQGRISSFYLVNGLKGLADKSKDGIITLSEIRNFMSSSFAADALIQQEHIQQTPSLKGDDNFVIAKVDTLAAQSSSQRNSPCKNSRCQFLQQLYLLKYPTILQRMIFLN